MTEDTRIFHESWYRIANEKICLKPVVRVNRRKFGSEFWYVLYNPFANESFRINQPSYEFIGRLGRNRTVEEIWKGLMNSHPQHAPGQEEIIRLLSQLYHANLLQYEQSGDTTKLFDRYKQRKQRMLQSNLMNIMFFRIPLFDPDVFLKRCLPFVRRIMSPLGALLWLGVVVSGLKVVIDNFSEVQLQSQGILAPSNLFLLYIGIVIIKAFHEFGHAFAVRSFGGEVHTIGVMFLIFSPLPYMDASAAWAFRSKWKRIFVGASGMIVEVFLAAWAGIIWANTGLGVIHSLAYNMLFVASVSTVIFNINPLLRYDGYYMLSDLLDIPNLHSQSSQELVYLVERYIFCSTNTPNPVSTKKEAWFLASFGILSGIYRIVVFLSILLFVADRFLLAGFIMAVVCAIAWVVIPLVRFTSYLGSSARLERVRGRAILVCALAAIFVSAFLHFFPFPSDFKAPGVLKAYEYVVVAGKIDGYIEEIFVPSNTQVKKGEILLRLRNPELEFQRKEAEAKLKEAETLLMRALSQQQADIAPLKNNLEAVRKRIQKIKEDKENLLVKAEIEGTWIAPLKDYIGIWLVQGVPVGQIINDKTFYFSSVVSQQEASRIFSNEIRKSRVKLSGEADIQIEVLDYTRIPMEHTILPSQALGWAGGGDIAVNTKDKSGKAALEPFYELRTNVSLKTGATLLQGRSGRIRFELGTEPLFKQWWRRLRQLIQKRYQI